MGQGWEAKYTKRKLLEQMVVDTGWRVDVIFQSCGGLRKELMKEEKKILKNKVRIYLEPSISMLSSLLCDMLDRVIRVW